MIIIYSTKPLLSKMMAVHFNEKYPNKKIVYIHSMYFKNIQFYYPKNIKWKNFPHVQEANFRINKIEDWNPLTLVNGELKPINISFSDILNSDEIIFSADPCSTDTYLFTKFIEFIFKEDINELKIKSITLNSLSKNEIINSINNISNFSQTFKDQINQGKIKKYFDYNFNFNSFALLNKFYLEVNHILKIKERFFITNDFGKIFISKNMLQLLYFIREESNNNILYGEGEIIYKMFHWKGTGKYNSSISAKIGNSASSSSIISNLLKLNLLELNNNKLFITEKGRKFLELLPKDCMDFDLPFRIKLWENKKFEDSKVQIDKYLNTYFKKLKHKLKQFN